MGLSRLDACLLSEGYVSVGFMSYLPVSGEKPVVPLPDREPAAIRAAVARLDPAALARFEAGWTAATARARDEYSLLPARYFVEHWFNWVAGARPHPKVLPGRLGCGVRGSGQAAGPGRRPRCGWRRRACPAGGSRVF